MELQYLDLDEHDPDEFSGKLIRWFGRDYIVGRRIATGAERIVHQLIDRDNGEFGFVVKFFRQPRVESTWKQPSDGRFYLHIHLLLTFALLEVAGGVVEIMPKLDGAPLGHQSKIERMARASKFAEEKNWAAAQEEYGKLSLEFPGDSELSYNLGATLTHVGDVYGALRAFEASAEADPFSVTARLAVVRCALASGNIDFAEHFIWDTLDFFPGNLDVRRLGVSLYQETGRPERAINLVTASRSIFSEYYADIIREFEKKNKARRSIEIAFREAEGDPKKIPGEVIKSALEQYPADPFMQINWAFFLRRKGDFSASADALIEQVPRVSWNVARACILNAAFSKILGALYREAMPLLHRAIYMYRVQSSARNWADLNSLGNWILDLGDTIGWIDDEPSSALALIRELQGSLRGESEEDSGLLKQLVAVYSNGVEEYKKRSAEPNSPNPPA